MHYTVNGLLIRAENAAKPVSQPNSFVIEYIARLTGGLTVLDYGCGRFRYTIPLAKMADEVVAVDSEFQLGRMQIIAGEETNLRAYAAEHLPNVTVSDVAARSWQRRRYDFALCTNVLSTVPFPKIRLSILREIRACLRSGTGQVLVSTQFRNTYFKTYASNPSATKHGDGWLIRSRHGAAFYGIIDKDGLAQLCRGAGLTVTESFVKGESAYVLATRPHSSA